MRKEYDKVARDMYVSCFHPLIEDNVNRQPVDPDTLLTMMETGKTCAHCGVEFLLAHGEPVCCSSCYDGTLPKATYKQL